MLAGNDKLLHKESIVHPVCNVEGTVVHVAIDTVYAGYIIISDTLKDDAIEAIDKLKAKKYSNGNAYRRQQICSSRLCQKTKHRQILL